MNEQLDRLETSVAQLRVLLESQETRLRVLERSTQAQPASLDLPVERQGVSPPVGDSEVDQSAAFAVVRATVSNKRYEPEDPDAEVYDSNIWYDVSYQSLVDRPIRSVKGLLQFCDLFGEPQFQIRSTIDEVLAPGAELATPGRGFSFNEFDTEHNWMLSTDICNMKIRFLAEAVLFTDGTVQEFASEIE